MKRGYWLTWVTLDPIEHYTEHLLSLKWHVVWRSAVSPEVLRVSQQPCFEL